MLYQFYFKIEQGTFISLPFKRSHSFKYNSGYPWGMPLNLRK